MRKNSYSPEEILIGSKGELFGPGKPKLPTPPMLMLDRISNINDNGGRYERGELTAELDLSPDMWFFQCHFLGDPVMPGCLGLDALWQLVGFYLAWSGHGGKGRALGCKEVKFTGQVLPENKLVTYHIEIKRVIIRKLIFATADGKVSVDGEDIYTAQDLKVGLFAE